MKSIGGYFELELRNEREYHSGAIKLNCGRNGLRYVLETKKYRKIHLPFYNCEVLLEPIAALGLSIECYSINRDFEPVFDFENVAADECFLYTNYFGLKDDYLKQLAAVCRNLIVDNAQAFYSLPLSGVDTFYSPRKFFGVPDGGYLYTDKLSDKEFTADVSCAHAEHLLIRSDLNAEVGYEVFQANEKQIGGEIKAMSSLTAKILKNIDYDYAAERRRKNFSFLSEHLNDSNQMNLSLSPDQVPLVYPFYTRQTDLRRQLTESKIYTAQYWANVLETAAADSVDYDFAANIVHLPVDQRINEEDLARVIEIVKQ